MITTTPTPTKVRDSYPVYEVWSWAWADSYRRHHAAADRWAAGFGAIRHTRETQDRIFRMAEQLAVRLPEGDVPLFDVLATADRMAALSMSSAADAGHRAIDAITEKQRTSSAEEDVACYTAQGGHRVVILSQPAATDMFEAALRRKGFDPVVFDGTDPAGYAWAIFEVESRLDAEADATTPGRPLRPCAIALSVSGTAAYEPELAILALSAEASAT